MAGFWQRILERRKPNAPRESETLVSAVALLPYAQTLEEPAVKLALWRAFGNEARYELAWWQESWLLAFNEQYFRIHAVAAPYTSREQLEQIQDLTLRESALEHNSWMSVDWAPGQTAPDDREAIRRAFSTCAKLLVELASEDTLLFFAPHLSRSLPYTGSSLARLRMDPPDEVFLYVPGVPQLETLDEAALARAAEEAQARWPEFVEAFGHKQEGDSFRVKAADESWLQVVELKPGSIVAMAEESGNAVEIDAAAIRDWLYSALGRTVGGFTLRALR